MIAEKLKDELMVFDKVQMVAEIKETAARMIS